MTSFNPLPKEKEASINFFIEEIDLQFNKQALIRQWIFHTIQKEEQQLGYLNFIFCSDSYLHKINIEYLDHDTYTDVITFPYSETNIEGDIFISIDRIKENAKAFKVSFDKELNRVIIHGVLHLLGYSDKSPTEKEQMTLKENFYLRLLHEE